ncbi:U4/U6 small nuclear ribonucleoprotein Prp31-like [Temnothorax curvispinosus]|uniref:U4/U6 small nuclear ribonucleoprotein Prp31-like n=1 Tax=Temnothorax curvispinosus TaxID=300111 RepID=A0A6J1RJJ7_9HYME|nr:U4/U6 small nuclear ribonucleoprotein Prp31-like [Temnothorax curvispinosus]XP_024892951.1 U4/U6 small nuclear ribonucleoprotein Prp31-like [Temnothorax curvispinosus]
MSKPLPKPIDPGPRKIRGGKRARKMKKRYASTEKTKIKISQALQKDLENRRHWGGTGEQIVQKQEVSVSGTASVAFNPLQNPVIVNRQAAEKRKLRRWSIWLKRFKRKFYLDWYKHCVYQKELDKWIRDYIHRHMMMERDARLEAVEIPS